MRPAAAQNEPPATRKNACPGELLQRYFARRHTCDKKYFVELLLLIVILIWAGNYTVGKFGMREFSPLLFTMLRYLIVTPLLLLLLKLREGGLHFSRAAMPRVIAVGLISNALYQTVFIAAVKYASVTTASLALGLSPIFTALLGAAVGQERLNSTILAGCSVAFGGLFLVITFGPEQAGLVHTFYGDALALAAAFLWGLYPILAKPLLKDHSALWVTSHSALVGAVALIAGSLPEIGAADWQAISWTGWAAVVYAGVPVTMSLVIWYYGIEKIGANQVMVYMYLLTPAAIAIAMLTIGEEVSLVQGVGAVIAILGVALVKRSPVSKTSE